MEDKVLELSRLIVELESKVAHQEQLLESLNQSVTQQQDEIGSLTAKFDAIIKRLRDLGTVDAFVRPGHEKPPHY
ncbi:MAG: SlyX family protein [Bdellovibrionaceae bacterium]|nr:SlyX family protein [Pseudobdellovibrionaceae bacterium]